MTSILRDLLMSQTQHPALPSSAVRKMAFMNTPQGQAPMPPQQAQPNVDPNTGLPVDPATGLLQDPQSGMLIDPQTGVTYDPATGQPVAGPGMQPAGGQPMAPAGAAPAGQDPAAMGGVPVDPATGAPMDPSAMGAAPADPAAAGQDPGSLPPEIQQVILLTVQQVLQTLGIQPGQAAPAAPAEVEKPKKVTLEEVATQVANLTQAVSQGLGIDMSQFQQPQPEPAPAGGEAKVAEESGVGCCVSDLPMDAGQAPRQVPARAAAPAKLVSAARRGQ